MNERFLGATVHIHIYTHTSTRNLSLHDVRVARWDPSVNTLPRLISTATCLRNFFFFMLGGYLLTLLFLLSGKNIISGLRMILSILNL